MSLIAVTFPSGNTTNEEFLIEGEERREETAIEFWKSIWNRVKACKQWRSEWAAGSFYFGTAFRVEGLTLISGGFGVSSGFDFDFLSSQ